MRRCLCVCLSARVYNYMRIGPRFFDGCVRGHLDANIIGSLELSVDVKYVGAIHCVQYQAAIICHTFAPNFILHGNEATMRCAA